MGSALESHWGAFRYNIYVLIGWIATVAASFLVPDASSSNVFLWSSVFLAFAFLYPDFQLYIFFILPVKIKWLALINWIFLGYTLIFAAMIAKLLALASILNFFLFFWSDIVDRLKTGRRHMAFQAGQMAAKRMESEPFHRCIVCGITDVTHPDMDFRYCPECKGSAGYCKDHIFNHEHIPAEIAN